MMKRQWLALLATLLLSLGWSGEAEAQRQRVAQARRQRVAVLTEAGTPVVATEVLLTTGPLDEPGDLHGLAYLSARAVAAPIEAALDSLGARLTITPQKDALSFSVIAAPDAWEEATRRLLITLFREPPSAEVVSRERAEIVTELRGRFANPADAATREADQAFFGLGHPWGRPTVGTPESVQRLVLDDVDTFLRANFTPDRAFVAVAGPVDESIVQRHLQPLLGSTFPAPVEVDPSRRAERPVREEYNSITTWISGSFAFPETVDEEAIRFVAYLAADALGFSLRQSSVYNVTSHVVPRVGGGEIRITVVVPPEEADEWAERVEEVIERVATRAMPEDIFHGHLRRYRGQRIMGLSAPEDRAHAAARQLLVGGEFRGLVPDLADLSQERVRSAASGLGDPTIVLLGPSLDL